MSDKGDGDFLFKIKNGNFYTAEIGKNHAAVDNGNFYLKPNGVFFVDREGNAGILESSAYLKANIKAQLAVQSGPLLVMNGIIHPKFNADSSNLKHRNGVGVNKDGKVIFAITDYARKEKINFYTFSEFFLSLACEDALFLDGDISAMIVNPDKPIHDKNEFGAIFAIGTNNSKSLPTPSPASEIRD